MNQSTEDLNRQYQIIISLPEKAFFIGVANYVRSVLESPDLDSVRAELSRKALSDYDKTIELMAEKNVKSHLQKNWKMDDFIAEGLKLGKKLDAIKDVSIKGQTEASHAWMKLQTLEKFIHDREKIKAIYSKTPRGQREYELSIAELDLIMSTKASERDSDEYEFWVESGRKESVDKIPRSIFVHNDFINYFAQVHSYFTDLTSQKQASSLIKFPEGQTVLYENGVLSFDLGDGTHDSIDFSTAPKQRKIFEVFWENKRRTLKNSITYSDAVDLYRELHGEEIDKRHFAYWISHIRGSKINKKPMLKKRIEINHVAEPESWNYNWY
jgi:hypothetical protein